MTLGTLSNSLGLGLLIRKIEIIIAPTSQGCCEELMSECIQYTYHWAWHIAHAKYMLTWAVTI